MSTACSLALMFSVARYYSADCWATLSGGLLACFVFSDLFCVVGAAISSPPASVCTYTFCDVWWPSSLALVGGSVGSDR